MIKTKYGMIIGTWKNVEYKEERYSYQSATHKQCQMLFERYLVGPWIIRFCATHNNQGHHSATIEYPCGETEEIN